MEYLSTINSKRNFHEIIHRECECADRYNKPFSLVVFELDTSSDNNYVVRNLVRVLHRRFRNINNVGWFSHKQIGVIMPYTPAEGGWVLAQDICGFLSTVSAPPPFTIFFYPSQNWPVQSSSKKVKQTSSFSWFSQLFSRNPLTSETEFRPLIRIERDRADRNGHIFSLILIDTNKLQLSQISEKSLLVKLNLRLRVSDAIGQYDLNQIGVLMPYATPDDSYDVALAVSSTMR